MNKKFKYSLIYALLVLCIVCFGAVNSTNALSRIPLSKVSEFYNVVVLGEYRDATYTKTELTAIDKIFNDNTVNETESVKEYFNKQSLGQLDVTTVFAFSSYELSSSAFRNSGAGESGLMTDIIKGVDKLYTKASDMTESTVLPKTKANLDKNNDDKIDCLVYYPKFTFSNSDANTSFWPHTLIGISGINFTVSDGTLKVDKYIVNPFSYKQGLSDKITNPIGVICHEMLHNIGESEEVDDLYHYGSASYPTGFDDITPVGIWDVMASTDYNNPQALNAYYMQKIGWSTLQSQEIDTTKTANASLGSGIKFGENAARDEFFVAEYRESTTINGVETESGVIIYRVNTKIHTGNRVPNATSPNKNNDEIYFLRAGGCLNRQHASYQNDHLETCATFDATFKNGTTITNSVLKYSNGAEAEFNVGITFDANTFTLNVKKNTIDFKLAINGIVAQEDIKVYINGNFAKTLTSTGTTMNIAFTDLPIGTVIHFESNNYVYEDIIVSASQAATAITATKVYSVKLTITDEDNLPLAGVNVSLNNVTSVADDNGNIVLTKVKLGDKISISKDLFETSVIEFNDETKLDITVTLAKYYDIKLNFLTDTDTKINHEIYFKINDTVFTAQNGTIELNKIKLNSSIVFYNNYNLDIYSDIAHANKIGSITFNDKTKTSLDVYIVNTQTNYIISLYNKTGDNLALSTMGISEVTYLLNGDEKVTTVLDTGKISISAKNGDVIVINLNGYKKIDITIQPNIQTNIELKIIKTISVSGQIVSTLGNKLADVKIFINDIEVAVTDSEGNFSLSNIEEGSKISFEKAGYLFNSQTIKESTLIIKVNVTDLYLIGAIAIIIIIASFTFYIISKKIKKKKGK